MNHFEKNWMWYALGFFGLILFVWLYRGKWFQAAWSGVKGFAMNYSGDATGPTTTGKQVAGDVPATAATDTTGAAACAGGCGGCE